MANYIHISCVHSGWWAWLTMPDLNGQIHQFSSSTSQITRMTEDLRPVAVAGMLRREFVACACAVAMIPLTQRCYIIARGCYIFSFIVLALFFDSKNIFIRIRLFVRTHIEHGLFLFANSLSPHWAHNVLPPHSFRLQNRSLSSIQFISCSAWYTEILSAACAQCISIGERFLQQSIVGPALRPLSRFPLQIGLGIGQFGLINVGCAEIRGKEAASRLSNEHPESATIWFNCLE